MVIGSGGQSITRITQEAESDLMKIFLREVRLKISAKLRKWVDHSDDVGQSLTDAEDIRKPERQTHYMGFLYNFNETMIDWITYACAACITFCSYKYVFIIINAKNHIVLHSYIDIHVCSEGKVHAHLFYWRKGLPCFLLFIVFSVVRLLSVVPSCCLTECLA